MTSDYSSNNNWKVIDCAVFGREVWFIEIDTATPCVQDLHKTIYRNTVHRLRPFPQRRSRIFYPESVSNNLLVRHASSPPCFPITNFRTAWLTHWITACVGEQRINTSCSNNPSDQGSTEGEILNQPSIRLLVIQRDTDPPQKRPRKYVYITQRPQSHLLAFCWWLPEANKSLCKTSCLSLQRRSGLILLFILLYYSTH